MAMAAFILAMLLFEQREITVFGEKQGGRLGLTDIATLQEELFQAKLLIQDLQKGCQDSPLPVRLTQEKPLNNTLQCVPRPIQRRVYRSQIGGRDALPDIFPQNGSALPYRLCTGSNNGDQACRLPEKDGKEGRLLTFDELSKQEEKTGIYKALTAKLQRLGMNSLQKSRKGIGNVFRFRKFLCQLLSGRPTRTLVVGGSNCNSNYLPSDEMAWPELLQTYLNEEFPVDAIHGNIQHVVVNRGYGGSGSCTFAARMSFLLQEKLPLQYDLVLAELAINDAQFADQIGTSVGYLAAPAMGGHYSIVSTCTEIREFSFLCPCEATFLTCFLFLLLFTFPGFQ
jgi:hypothetical protein